MTLCLVISKRMQRGPPSSREFKSIQCLPLMVDRWKGAALQLSSIQGSKIFRSFYPCHHAESKQLLLPRIVMSPPWQVEGTSVRLQFNDWQGVRMNYSICGASARVIETSFHGAIVVCVECGSYLWACPLRGTAGVNRTLVAPGFGPAGFHPQASGPSWAGALRLHV